MTSLPPAVSAPESRPDATSPLATWLAYLESIHARPIDMGLDRVREVAARMKLDLQAVKIVVGGTNGKGSTCAMLEAILLAAGYQVGLYTSPHLIDFNERARINGENATDAALTEQFAAVDAARGEVSLTYFELTTLAILRLFAQRKLDVVVLEIGLGGRLDAVNIVDADCAIVTSVDIDHTEFLGDTRELIGSEKAHIYRAGRPAICADPMPPASLVAHAEAIGADLWLFGRDFNYSGDKQQWSYGGRGQRRNSLAYPALRGANQLLNASAALAALEALRDQLAVPAQAVRLGLLQVQLPARFQILPGQPTVILDVAHNPHAAAVLGDNLGNMGFYPYTHAVLGMLSDKDIPGVIAKVARHVDHWYCTTLEGPRGLDGEALAAALRAAGITEGADSSITAWASPAEAFAAARARAGDGDRIVVFGSFLTVAGVVSSLRSAATT
jgi:dihydrofolate synthase/folylpolyglutamate synthase